MKPILLRSLLAALSNCLPTIMKHSFPSHRSGALSIAAWRRSKFFEFLRGLICLTSFGALAGSLPAVPLYEPVAGFSTPPNHPEWGNLYLHSDGKLYGTTLYGGGHSIGTIYAIDPVTRKWETIIAFGGDVIGSNPRGGLVGDDQGFLWGTTTDDNWQTGSSSTGGTVFKLDPGTRTLTTVAWGGLSMGRRPASTLVRGTQGWLWGTTSYGTHGPPTATARFSR